MMPRRITVYLSAPPGDNLRPVREHFKEYVKPILVAGGLDWEVVEGKREGELRAGLAERVRKLREKAGERAPPKIEEDTRDKGIQLVRDQIGIREWDGVKGDLVIGRHTWKEYTQGLHEGWLGPMEPSQLPPSSDLTLSTLEQQDMDSADSPTAGEHREDETSKRSSTPEPPKAVSSIGPYIKPSSYPEATLPPTPVEISPSTALPFPHLLGFINTPRRTYRFLSRRRLADTTGAQVAAMVLASRTTSFEEDTATTLTASADSAEIDHDVSSSVTDANRAGFGAETPTSSAISQVLADEEHDWHKSAFAPDPDTKSEDQSPSTALTSENLISQPPQPPDRPWRDRLVVDPRIARRMSRFELEPGSEKRAEMLLHDQDKKKKENQRIKFHQWVDRWRNNEQEKKGWEMGLEGDEDL